MDPKVSFIVPCYKLAHYLGDCVNSILAQTYSDFEILIMDDCSPDNTPEVAAGFNDPRVTYIRNETNLGNIRNYNKGIKLSRGRYLWLISADDCLRSQNVLRRYVELLEKNPHVGYVFCPAMSLLDGKELGVEAWTAWPGKRDRIINGRDVVRLSIYRCTVCAPTGLVRKECYTRIGGFPLDLPRSGDWFLWSVFATMYDVGYLAEPMVCYRRHTTNMDKTLVETQPSLFYEQELLVRWLIKKEAEKAGMQGLSSHFCRGLAEAYILRLVDKEVKNWQHGYTWDFARKEIHENASNEKEAEEILRLIRTDWPGKLAVGHTRVGAGYYKIGQIDEAITAFKSALAQNPWAVKPRIYLWASRLERLLGLRLIPCFKLLKKTLLLAYQHLIRWSSIIPHHYVEK